MKTYKRIHINEPQINYSDKLFESWMKSYRLTEKTFSINRDVDYIYNKFFKKSVEAFQKKGTLPELGEYGRLHTSTLKSKDCIVANSKHPVFIYCGAFKGGSYNMFNKGEEVIIISVNHNAIEYMYQRDMMDDNMRRSIDNEITEHRLKEVIYHELAHWISDAKYNDYLHNLVAKANNIPKDAPYRSKKIKDIMKMGKADVNMTHFEIDAQIHGIKQAKRTFKKEWDEMTLVDLFYRYNALRNIASTLFAFGENVYRLWVKDLVKRMHREGLLGKNMKAFPKYEMIESQITEDYLKI